MARTQGQGREPSGFFSALGPFVRRVAGEDPRQAALSLFLSTGLACTEGAGLLLVLPLAALSGILPLDEGSRFASWLPSWRPPLWGLLIFFVLVISLRSLLMYWSNVLRIRYTQEHVHRLRKRVFTALSRTSWSTFLDLDPADLVQALTVDIQRESFALTSLLNLVGAVAVLLMHGTLAALVGPVFALFALVVGVVLSLLMGRQHRRTLDLGRRLQSEHRDLQAATREQIATLKLYKAHGLTHRAAQTMNRVNDRIAEMMVGVTKRQGLVGVLFQIGSACSLALAVWGAVNWARLHPVDLSLLVVIFARLLPRVAVLQTSLQGLAQCLGNAEAVQRLLVRLETSPAADDEGEGEALALETELRLEGISFAYEAGRPVLEDVSLVVPAHGLVVVEGPSGCGKSTLVDVILGLLRPTAGRILVDGVPLSDADFPRWLRGVAMVTQSPLLFDGSLRDNLAWAALDDTDEALLEALDRAGARGLAAHAEGLDRPVGEGGRFLSGGERRRLSLARALLRRPGFLVLDEPLSGLDPKTAAAVADTVVALKAEATILAVCHTGPLLRRADRVHALSAPPSCPRGEEVPCEASGPSTV